MKKVINKRISIKTVILLALSAACIAFIWFQSAMSALDSSLESGGVMDFINNILKSLGFSAAMTDHIVRKSAHFCEFMLLGILTYSSAYSIKKKFFANLMPVGFVCLATAVTDEFIQYYSDGRSAEVGDVVLDFAGAVAGVLIVSAIISLIKLIRR